VYERVLISLSSDEAQQGEKYGAGDRTSSTRRGEERENGLLSTVNQAIAQCFQRSAKLKSEVLLLAPINMRI